ncbi:hypothetical protein NDU88_006204 [Pleurodeles waltl]|uniref:Secreted protein n=1 Tax=Pleurodeles waltl TaxID=8319 RepID=A0AAV7NTQ7_PLEWA|nr:hypothetical protein NDU88_006204 [Pleurodeles waltl]
MKALLCPLRYATAFLDCRTAAQEQGEHQTSPAKTCSERLLRSCHVMWVVPRDAFWGVPLLGTKRYQTSFSNLSLDSSASGPAIDWQRCGPMDVG